MLEDLVQEKTKTKVERNTFGATFNDWFEIKRQNLKEKSANCIRRRFETYLLPDLGNKE